MVPNMLPIENAHEIIPRLWLGNIRAAQDEHFLKEKGIETVFNCTKDLPFSPYIRRRYRVPVDDNLKAEEIRNLELWSYEIIYKLNTEYKEGHPILVHCAAGMQRSPAVVAMFLIAVADMKSEEAMSYIQSKRPVAFFLNANFRSAIKGFEESLQKFKLEQSNK
jgi:protein tyrosine/serine phosphatase